MCIEVFHTSIHCMHTHAHTHTLHTHTSYTHICLQSCLKVSYMLHATHDTKKVLFFKLLNFLTVSWHFFCNICNSIAWFLSMNIEEESGALQCHKGCHAWRNWNYEINRRKSFYGSDMEKDIFCIWLDFYKFKRIGMLQHLV